MSAIAGRVLLVPKGNYDSTVTYTMLDMVVYNGSSYICKQECTGVVPTNTTYWMLNASGSAVAYINDIGDVVITNPTNGQVLMYDSTTQKWVNGTLSTTLAGLTDTQIASLQNGQVLKYNATSQKWENAEDTGGLLPHLIVISETGSIVTATKGQTVITATETSTGHFECDVPEFGTWTIHAVLGGDDAIVNLVVDTVKVYTVDDSHFHADITVKYPSGATCNLAGQGESYYATGSPYTFTVHHAGQYTITVVYDGQTYTDSVTVTTTGETISEVVPSPSSVPANDINWWLFFGGVSGTFSTLEEILANSTALATLMASTDAVDYLVRCKEWINAGLVPVMTSNTTPSGEAISSSDYSASIKAYMAFNNDSSNNWMGLASDNNPWIGYIFEEAKVIRRVGIKFINCIQTSSPFAYVEGSNDGINWAIIHTGNVQYNALLGEQTLTFTNENAYTRYRVRFSLTLYVGGSYNAYVEKVQFYEFVEGITENQSAMSYIGLNNYCANTLLADADWRDGICNSVYFESVLNVKVPVMTSNTTPSGECFGVNANNSEYYKAFDNNNSTSTVFYTQQNATCGYKFSSKTRIYRVELKHLNNQTNTYNRSVQLQGSDDSSTYTNIHDFGTVSVSGTSTTIRQNILANNQYYKIVSTDNSTGSQYVYHINEIQFYGREDV